MQRLSVVLTTQIPFDHIFSPKNMTALQKQPYSQQVHPLQGLSSAGSMAGNIEDD
jgi:hypothetical protein